MNISKFSLVFKIYFLSCLLLLLLPQTVMAAQVIFEVVPQLSAKDKTVVIEVKIDPHLKNLNALEGVVGLKGVGAEKIFVQTETGGSIFTLWPSPPKYFANEQVIRFVGGVPGGFNQPGLIFRLRISSVASNQVNLNWISGSAYLNDGLGTAEGISSNSKVINLEPQALETTSVSLQDQRPPIFEMLEIGQDPSVYDGKYFVSFYATDDLSGVASYAVKEGEDVTEVRDGIYVLKDQSLHTPIFITAYDQAGNSRIEKFIPRFNWFKNVIIILLILLLISIFIYGTKKFIKK